MSSDAEPHSFSAGQELLRENFMLAVKCTTSKCTQFFVVVALFVVVVVVCGFGGIFVLFCFRFGFYFQPFPWEFDKQFNSMNL